MQYLVISSAAGLKDPLACMLLAVLDKECRGVHEERIRLLLGSLPSFSEAGTAAECAFLRHCIGKNVLHQATAGALELAMITELPEAARTVVLMHCGHGNEDVIGWHGDASEMSASGLLRIPRADL